MSSLNQTSDVSSFSTNGSFSGSSNFKTVSSINLNRETPPHSSYECSGNALPDKYFSTCHLPGSTGAAVETPNASGSDEADECKQRLAELESKYTRIFKNLLRQTNQDSEDYYKLKAEFIEKQATVESQKLEIDALYTNLAKAREDIDNLQRENEMLKTNYNNIDESFLGYHQQYKHLDGLGTLPGKHLPVNVGSMPGFLNKYTTKSTGHLNVVAATGNRHNSVLLGDQANAVVQLNPAFKYRDEHQSHHHLQPSSSSTAATAATKPTTTSGEDLCASAEDILEQVQLQGEEKQPGGLLNRLRRLGRRKTFKA